MKKHAARKKAGIQGSRRPRVKGVAKSAEEAAGQSLAEKHLELRRRIAEGEQVEKALRDRERTLATLMSNLPGVVYRCRNDRAWTMEFISEGCLSLCGYPARDVLSGAVAWGHDIIHPEDRAPVWDAVQQAVADGVPFQLTYRIVTATGELRWVWEQGIGVLDGQGGLEALEGYITDITERRRVEEERLESEARYHSLVSNAPFCIHEIDLQGRILSMNPAGLAMMGVRGEKEVVGLPYVEMVASGDRKRVQRLMRRAIAGHASSFEFVAAPAKRRRKIRYFASSFVPLRRRGGVSRLMGITRDVTERRISEEQQSQTIQELLRSNTELERFAYVASHDLQEPLRAIYAYTAMLENNYQAALDTRGREFLQYISDGAARMRDLVSALLAYSRLGAQNATFDLTSCEDVLTHALSNLNVTIQENRVRVTHNPLPVVTAARTQIIQLFQNLIANAIKYRGKRPPEIHISVSRQGDAWQFEFQDNGIGIEKKYQKRIFEIFTRLHSRKEYPGTGLGLAICRKVVENHGGRIWVESKPRQGARFFFTIPIPDLKPGI